MGQMRKGFFGVVRKVVGSKKFLVYLKIGEEKELNTNAFILNSAPNTKEGGNK